MAENKLAAILLLQEHGLDHLVPDRHLDEIAGWSRAPVLWRRRAAAVVFVNLAPHGDANFAGFMDLVLEVAGELVKDPQRSAQTAVGWVLRELSKAEPAIVRSFIANHVGELSREAIRMATARLPDADRGELLEAHNGNADVAAGHAGS